MLAVMAEERDGDESQQWPLVSGNDVHAQGLGGAARNAAHTGAFVRPAMGSLLMSGRPRATAARKEPQGTRFGTGVQPATDKTIEDRSGKGTGAWRLPEALPNFRGLYSKSGTLYL